MRTLALGGAALGTALLAALGIALLVFVYVARSFTPASAHIVRPLYFDYSQVEAKASVSLLDSAASSYYTHSLRELKHHKKASMWKAAERFLQPGEQITLWLELQLPEPLSEARHDIFQAVGELRAAEGDLVARASRPVLPARQSILLAPLRLFVLSPLSAVGLRSEWTTMQVTLFERYSERVDKPFALFQATLQGRAGGGLPPPVATAALHIRIHLGALRRMLYWVRPSTPVAVCLVLAGVCAALGGAGLATLFAALWLWSVAGGRGSGSRPDSAPQEDDTLSTESGVDDISPGELSPDSEDESPWGGDPLEEPAAEEEIVAAEAAKAAPDLNKLSFLAPVGAGQMLRRRHGSAGALGAGPETVSPAMSPAAASAAGGGGGGPTKIWP